MKLRIPTIIFALSLNIITQFIFAKKKFKTLYSKVDDLDISNTSNEKISSRNNSITEDSYEKISEKKGPFNQNYSEIESVDDIDDNYKDKKIHNKNGIFTFDNKEKNSENIINNDQGNNYTFGKRSNSTDKVNNRSKNCNKISDKKMKELKKKFKIFLEKNKKHFFPRIKDCSKIRSKSTNAKNDTQNSSRKRSD